jgi:hypothetical protein
MFLRIGTVMPMKAQIWMRLGRENSRRKMAELFFLVVFQTTVACPTCCLAVSYVTAWFLPLLPGKRVEMSPFTCR